MKAITIRPDDPRFQTNLRIAKRKLKRK